MQPSKPDHALGRAILRAQLRAFEHVSRAAESLRGHRENLRRALSFRDVVYAVDRIIHDASS